MTVPTYQVPDSAPRRPTTVTISSILLFVVAGVQLLSAVLVLSMREAITTAYESIEGVSDAEVDLDSFVGLVLAGTAILYALIAIGLVVLAVFNNLGKNGSRVTTWVFGGLGLCCNTIGLGSSAATGLAQAGQVNQQQLDAELALDLPGWYEPVSIGSSLVIVFALIGAIILLALPASNAYFTRRPAGWNPAMPYPQYPGQPGYPVAQPGYPTGQPGYPVAQPGQPTGQPGYPVAQPGQPAQQYPGYPAAQQAYPATPSHLGTPEQYGQPGQPAPGLQSYPGQTTPGPSATEPPTSDPWAQTPDATQVAPVPPVPTSPAAPPSSEPTSDPWASPQEPFPAAPSQSAPQAPLPVPTSPAGPSSPEPASDPWASPAAEPALPVSSPPVPSGPAAPSEPAVPSEPVAPSETPSSAPPAGPFAAPEPPAAPPPEPPAAPSPEPRA